MNCAPIQFLPLGIACGGIFDKVFVIERFQNISLKHFENAFKMIDMNISRY